MVATDRRKYGFYERLRPQLFDLRENPQELVDLGADTGHRVTLRGRADRLFEWSRRRKTQVLMTNADVERLSSLSAKRLIGLQWVPDHNLEARDDGRPSRSITLSYTYPPGAEGYGRVLMQVADAIERKQGLRAITFHTNTKMHENIAFYFETGFVESVRKTQDGFDRVLFRKTLA